MKRLVTVAFFTFILIKGLAASADAPRFDGDMNGARRSAARAAGWVIGSAVAEQALREEHNSRAFLERQRSALRGHLLRRYAFEGSPYKNDMRGYLRVTRDGRDGAGRYCRELEMDLVYQGVRNFKREVACLFAHGVWRQVDLASVHFSESPNRRGETSQPPSPIDGDRSWLPPFKK